MANFGCGEASEVHGEAYVEKDAPNLWFFRMSRNGAWPSCLTRVFRCLWFLWTNMRHMVFNQLEEAGVCKKLRRTHMAAHEIW